MELLLLGLLWNGVIATTAAVTRACCTCPGPDVVTRPVVEWPPRMAEVPGNDEVTRRVWGPVAFTQAEFAAFGQYMWAEKHAMYCKMAAADPAGPRGPGGPPWKEGFDPAAWAPVAASSAAEAEAVHASLRGGVGFGSVEAILDRAQERARELARKAAKKGAR